MGGRGVEDWRVEWNFNAQYKAEQKEERGKRKNESNKVERQMRGGQREEKWMGVTGKKIIQCFSLQSMCECACVNIHCISIFITLRETGLFFHPRVQGGSLSLLPQRSRSEIITSYFFVKPPENNGSCQKIRREQQSMTHDERPEDTESENTCL